jgi:hypothetical protein
LQKYVDGDGITIWISTSQAFGARQDVNDERA